jgi:uncharacterized membrane protein (DUF485 family)
LLLLSLAEAKGWQQAGYFPMRYSLLFLFYFFCFSWLISFEKWL